MHGSSSSSHQLGGARPSASPQEAAGSAAARRADAEKQKEKERKRKEALVRERKAEDDQAKLDKLRARKNRPAAASGSSQVCLALLALVDM